MSIFLKIGFLLSVLSICFGMAQTTGSTGEYTGSVAPRCFFTAPSVTQAMYRASDSPTQDGFQDKLEAINRAGRSLQFTISCNGSKVKITFSHPVKQDGPALAPSTRFVTQLHSQTSTRPLLEIDGTNPSATDTYTTPASIASPTPFYFFSTIYNGGYGGPGSSIGKVPLLAGNYVFQLTTNIVASN